MLILVEKLYMKRPTWGTVMGVIFILSGLFGIFNGIQDMNVRKLTQMVHETTEKITNEAESKTKNPNHNAPDSADLEVLTMFGDSIFVDNEGNVDLAATMSAFVHVSEYRMVWMKKIAYVAILLGIFLIAGGIFLFQKTKYAIPVGITTLVLCIALAIFKLFIFAADTETGKAISLGEKFSNYFAIFFYVLFLIIFMVMDKSYYQGAKPLEDYYDKA